MKVYIFPGERRREKAPTFLRLTFLIPEGRSVRGSSDTPIMVRLQSDDLELLDLWITANDPDVSRARKAIRRILRLVAMRVGNAMP